MRMFSGVAVALAGLAGPGAPAAWADLYSAQAAYTRGDFARAFQDFRELAELGDVRGQEYLAAMYVQGEGVARDNVLGYSWAKIAQENGGGKVTDLIVSQIEPHVREPEKQKAAALKAQFGKAAIATRWLPEPEKTSTQQACKLQWPRNPDAYYPEEGEKRGFSGKIMVGFTVGADGRAHNARVWFATPKDLFDDAARAVILASTFKLKLVDGIAVPCRMHAMVRFINNHPRKYGDQEIEKSFKEVQPGAVAGDPAAQAVYGILLATRPELNPKDEAFLPWLTRAAQAGMPAAQYMLAMCILDGYQTKRDETKGLAWLNKAATNGNADAQAALADYLLHSGKPGDDAQALQWLEKSAAAVNRDGIYAFAALLATSPNPALRDPNKALDVVKPLKPEVDALPTALEIRAAAQAFVGNFEAAQSDQRHAIRKAKALNWSTAPLENRLNAYAAGQTWTGDLFAL
jgi:TonB family protein